MRGSAIDPAIGMIIRVLKVGWVTGPAGWILVFIGWAIFEISSPRYAASTWKTRAGSILGSLARRNR